MTHLRGGTPFSIASEKGFLIIMSLLIQRSQLVDMNKGWSIDDWAVQKSVYKSKPSNTIQTPVSAHNSASGESLTYTYEAMTRVRKWVVRVREIL